MIVVLARARAQRDHVVLQRGHHRHQRLRRLTGPQPPFDPVKAGEARIRRAAGQAARDPIDRVVEVGDRSLQIHGAEMQIVGPRGRPGALRARAIASRQHGLERGQRPGKSGELSARVGDVLRHRLGEARCRDHDVLRRQRRGRPVLGRVQERPAEDVRRHFAVLRGRRHCGLGRGDTRRGRAGFRPRSSPQHTDAKEHRDCGAERDQRRPQPSISAKGHSHKSTPGRRRGLRRPRHVRPRATGRRPYAGLCITITMSVKAMVTLPREANRTSDARTANSRPLSRSLRRIRFCGHASNSARNSTVRPLAAA